MAIGLEEEIKLSPAMGFWREISCRAVSLPSLTSGRTQAGQGTSQAHSQRVFPAQQSHKATLAEAEPLKTQ